MRPIARLLSIAAIAVLATSTLAARADTYLYNFNFPTAIPQPDLPAVNVSFDESAILTVDTTIEASSFLAGSTATTTSLIIIPESGGCDQNPIDPNSCVEAFSSTPDGIIGVLFADGDQLTSPGSYTVLGGSATLTITDLTTSSPPTVTPEPSSLVLLGTGLLGLLAAARRRLFLNPAKLALLAALVAFSHPLLADTVYTYTGNDFTTFDPAGPYTTSDSITGSFTVASPLADGLSLQQIAFTSYSFTDGVQTMTNLNSTFLDPILNIATDSHGNVLYWDIELNDSSPSGLTNDFIYSIFYPPTGFDVDLGQLAPTTVLEGNATNFDVGTWAPPVTVTSSPTGVTPEPSSLILLGTGLLTAIGAARRRLAGRCS